MNKNNKKTMNERTHNSLDLYKNPAENPFEEFAEDFEFNAKSASTNKFRNPQKSNKK